MKIKFGTDGWRAIISDQFTFANLRRVAQAMAAYVKNHKLAKKGVIVGYDSRFLSEHFAEEAAQVMIQNGIPTVITERDIPTPILAFEVKDRKAAGAIMITASHNPPEYSGIKFIPEYAGPASQEITDEIESYISEKERPLEKKVAIPKFDPRERYFRHMELLLDMETIKRAKLKVVYDPMFGAGRGCLDKLLQNFGCRTEVIHGSRDVLFGGLEPEPVEENLTSLKNKVKEMKADLGVATDGDGDRFGIVDEQGQFLNANQVVALLLIHLIEDKGLRGGIVRSAATTHMLDKIAGQHKLKVYETPVGFKYIAEHMLKENIMLGGEESGGLTIKGHVPEKDGMLANLLLIEMIAQRGKPLSKLFEDLTSKVGTFISQKEDFELEERKKQAVVEALKKSPPFEIAGVHVDKVITLDGVKLVLKDGSWLLARPSGTEPLLRVYFEANTQEKVNRLKEDIDKIIKGMV